MIMKSQLFRDGRLIKFFPYAEPSCSKLAQKLGILTQSKIRCARRYDDGSATPRIRSSEDNRSQGGNRLNKKRPSMSFYDGTEDFVIEGRS